MAVRWSVSFAACANTLACFIQDASSIYRCLYFKTHPDTEVEAVVVSIRQNGFIAFVPRYGFKGPVYLSVCAHVGCSGIKASR